MFRSISFTLATCIVLSGCKSGVTVTAPPKKGKYAGIIAPLIDPAKLDTLKGDRAANSRIKKIVYWIETARQKGQGPADVIKAAHAINKQSGFRADEQRASIIRNRRILEKLGCLTDNNMAKLRRGYAPTITLGRYAGEIAEVDHIIPYAVCPELDCKLYNLELMPKTLNRKKSDKVGDRQLQLARKWHEAGLLSKAGLSRVMRRR